MKRRSHLAILVFLMLMASFAAVSYAEEEQEEGIFISSVSLSEVYANTKTEYYVKVIDAGVEPGTERDKLPAADAKVSIRMTKGSQELKQELVFSGEEGYKGEVTFPEAGLWNIVISAVDQNNEAHSDMLEMELTVKEKSNEMTYLWLGIMALFAAGIIYVIFRIRKLMKR